MHVSKKGGRKQGDVQFGRGGKGKDLLCYVSVQVTMALGREQWDGANGLIGRWSGEGQLEIWRMIMGMGARATKV